MSAERAKSSTTVAVERLRSMIVSGELSAHSDHLESELAERLGLSRTPVREATLVLQEMGLLQVRPRKGVRITPVTVQDMREVYDILTELESLAAARAAEAGYGPEDLDGLARATHAMDQALSDGDRAAWALADEAFHTELVRLGGNLRLIEIVRTYTDQVRRARTATLHARPLPLASNEDHRAVYDAILRGDPEAARRLHRSHRESAAALLTDLMQEMGLRYL